MAQIYRSSDLRTIVIPENIAEVVLGVSELNLRESLGLATGSNAISIYISERRNEGILALSPENVFLGLRYLLKPPSKRNGEHLTSDLRRLVRENRETLKRIRKMAEKVNRSTEENHLYFSWSTPSTPTGIY